LEQTLIADAYLVLYVPTVKIIFRNDKMLKD